MPLGTISYQPMSSQAADDMQFTPPPSAARKRRAAHDELDDTRGSPQLVWQQAFKRLRVNDQENHMYSENSGDAYGYAPSQLTWPQYNQQQQPYNNLYSTPPPKQPAPEPPPETDYKRNNQVLGQLHRERRLREQEEARRLYSTTSSQQHSQDSSCCYSSSSYGSEQETLMDSPAEPRFSGAVHLFGSPMRRRNVVTLPTDSKLV